MSASSWVGGLAGRGPLRRWRCGRGSCWPVPRVPTTRPPRLGWAVPRRRSASGGGGSSRTGWTGWSTSHGRVLRAASPTSRSSRCWWRPWSGRPGMRRTGRGRRWPPSGGSRSQPWVVSGGRSASSRTWWTASSCRPTRCSSRRSATWSASTSIPRSGPWCCVWMRSPGSRHSTGPAPVLPMMPGMPERRTHDYVRAGTTTLFAALDVADGTVIGSLHRRRRAVEFKKFLTKIDTEVPPDLDVHLICDNLSTHKTPAIDKWLAAHQRFHMHFTPTSSSWLNQVERWFGLLTDKKLRRGVHRSVQSLENDIRLWIKTWNENPRPFAWTKTADEILERLASYIERIPGGAH